MSGSRIGLSSPHPKVSVVVCALNEAENVAFALEEIPNQVDEVILVDGGSTDGTVHRAVEMRPDIKLVSQSRPGKDGAMQEGISKASGEVVVTLDCDGETSALDLPRFLDALMSGADFAKGSRFVNGTADKPLLRLLGNRVIVSFFNSLYSTRFTDVCSGLNAFWRERAERAGIWDSREWNFEPRIIARALRGGLRVVEVPQRSRGRQRGRSKLPNLRQGFLALWYPLRERFR